MSTSIAKTKTTSRRVCFLTQISSSFSLSKKPNVRQRTCNKGKESNVIDERIPSLKRGKDNLATKTFGKTEDNKENIEVKKKTTRDTRKSFASLRLSFTNGSNSDKVRRKNGSSESPSGVHVLTRVTEKILMDETHIKGIRDSNEEVNKRLSTFAEKIAGEAIMVVKERSSIKYVKRSVAKVLLNFTSKNKGDNHDNKNGNSNDRNSQIKILRKDDETLRRTVLSIIIAASVIENNGNEQMALVASSTVMNASLSMTIKTLASDVFLAIRKEGGSKKIAASASYTIIDTCKHYDSGNIREEEKP